MPREAKLMSGRKVTTQGRIVVPAADVLCLKKQFFDICTASLLLIVLAAPLLLVAVVIRIETRGPIFFRQPRIGLNSQVFLIWKFRTMYHEHSDISGVSLTTRDDPRLTRVGAWLRRWSIDELPQLLNVLEGNMSLVGPRPHALGANVGGRLYQNIVPHYMLRHQVKPGITGWAQANGCRGETRTIPQITLRVAYDLQYIESWSLLFDIRIILMTIRREIWSHRAF